MCSYELHAAACIYGRAVTADTHAGAGSPEQPPGLVPPPRPGAAGANRESGQGCCADEEYCRPEAQVISICMHMRTCVPV